VLSGALTSALGWGRGWVIGRKVRAGTPQSRRGMVEFVRMGGPAKASHSLFQIPPGHVISGVQSLIIGVGARAECGPDTVRAHPRPVECQVCAPRNLPESTG